MTWRTEVFSGHWADRGCVFATREEAASYGAQLTHIDRRPFRAVECSESVNQTLRDGKLIRSAPRGGFYA
jgi:hypothetical protein